MDIHYPGRMAQILEETANLTAQNQITIPAPIRRALNLQGGKSKVVFQLQSHGRVLVFRAAPKARPKSDPALGPFLKLLANDMKAHPERIKPFRMDLLKRAHDLVGDIAVNLDEPLSGKE